MDADRLRFLCLGWRGTPRQWKMQAIAGILLSALVLPIFVSVHSIVSWDFAIQASVEGWHSTIFAPYFIIGPSTRECRRSPCSWC